MQTSHNFGMLAYGPPPENSIRSGISSHPITLTSYAGAVPPVQEGVKYPAHEAMT